MEPRKLVVDTDPGADDAVALLVLSGYAARGRVEVLGVGSVYGNVSAPQAADNALRVLQACGLGDVPVAVGADGPLRGDRLGTAEFVHGHDGLGGAAGPATERRPVVGSAAEQLVAIAREHPGEVSLLALGPLTNVALALGIEPELPSLLREVVWMGARIRVPGNLTAHADANTLHDAIAADQVLAAGFPLTVVPLDATQSTWAGERWLARVAEAKVPLADYALAVIEHYVGVYSDIEGHRRGGRGCVLHDPVAAVLMLEPDLAGYEEHPVVVELEGRYTYGATLVDLRGYVTPVDPGPQGRPPVRIAMTVDADAVLDRIGEALGAVAGPPAC
ncbi:nucleoside hydrolase [Saccharothrix sp. NRRL B-16348]|uniref:nucleoside hydrolase n=1 Tax=Saccharothrix sp. NRRL B-16348 TaxID=1415542 RepID=UPI000A5CD1F2|nr:nucleoside hydrolase [Saccharothrix sp. NRRL B-16348]